MVHKEHADNKRGATESPVAPGDLVLPKNTKTSGKLEANFESEPYTVQTKEGSEVTVRSKEGVEYRRNSALVLSGITHQRNYRKPQRPFLKTLPIPFRWRRI